MKVLVPTAITEAMLVSSSIAEDDYPEWDAATNYAVGDRRIRAATHRVYEALQAGIDATAPENALTGVTPRWLDLGATNRWAAFDEVVGTASQAPLTLEVSLQAGLVQGVALLEIGGATQAVVTMTVGAEVVYDKTVDLDASVVTNYDEYFFSPALLMTELVLTDLPPYAEAVVHVSLTGPGVVSVGVLAVGMLIDIGKTGVSARPGIIDYSRKTTDTFGRTSLTEGDFARRSDFSVYVSNARLNYVYRVLSDQRAKKCIWIGSEYSTFSLLILYGNPMEFVIEVKGAVDSLCSLQIQGLT